MSAPVAGGVCLTLYNGDRLAHAVDPTTARVLEAARPEVVMLHGGPRVLLSDAPVAMAAVRVHRPGARLWLGVGCDGWTSFLAEHPDRASVVAGLARGLAELAVAHGVEVLVWDQEAAGEAHPEAGALFARTVLGAVRAARPGLLHAHTAYDHPVAVPISSRHSFGGHERYPWEAWLREGGVDFMLPQTYVAESVSLPAGPGALAHRQATSAESFRRLTAKGRCRPGLAAYRYVQLWGVGCSQTIQCELGSELWCGWAAPGPRWDLDGRLALLAACELRRRGVRDAAGVAALQRELGVTADGVVGRRETIPALGIREEDWR